MAEAPAAPTAGRAEQIVGNLLRLGVTVAATVVTAGAVIYLIRHGLEAPHYRVFHGEPSDLRTVPGIWHMTLTWHGRGLIQLGLLLLIATPIARVVYSLYDFARQRDRLYVVVTLIVLGVLLLSLLGKVG
jgi:uncharacterized membrane protein